MNSSNTVAGRHLAIDELDHAIVSLSARINAATYELLVLFRESTHAEEIALAEDAALSSAHQEVLLQRRLAATMNRLFDYGESPRSDLEAEVMAFEHTQTLLALEDAVHRGGASRTCLAMVVTKCVPRIVVCSGPGVCCVVTSNVRLKQAPNSLVPGGSIK